METWTGPMGRNDRDFNRKYLPIQVGRQCQSIIATQKYSGNNNGGGNNNRFSSRFVNSRGGNNNGFHNNK